MRPASSEALRRWAAFVGVVAASAIFSGCLTIAGYDGRVEEPPQGEEAPSRGASGSGTGTDNGDGTSIPFDEDGGAPRTGPGALPDTSLDASLDTGADASADAGAARQSFLERSARL